MKKRQKKVKNRFITFYNRLVENSKYKYSWLVYLIVLISSIVLISVVSYYLSEYIKNSTTRSERNIYYVFLTIALIIFAWSVYFSVVMIFFIRKLYNEKSCRLYFEVYVKIRKYIWLDFHKYSYDELFFEEIDDAKKHPNNYNKIYL